MPEGPELAYSRDKLKLILENKRIILAYPQESGRYSKKYPDGYEEFLVDIQLHGAPIVEEISTKGKFMWWRMKFKDISDPTYLWVTYGMSGQWMTKQSKHSGFVVEYENGNLYFNDPRHFGTIKFVKNKKDHNKKLASLGPCILTETLSPEIFSENILRKPNRTISEALMDQSVIAGVGNYLKSESLHRSKISPWRIVTDLTAEEYIRLCKDVIDVAAESYASQGASMSTYRNVDGSKGTTQFNFKIYSQKMCPCGRESTRQTTPDGRTSWWCQSCQL